MASAMGFNSDAVHTVSSLTGLTKLGGKGWKLVEKSVKHGNIINPRDVYHQFMFILSI